MKKWYIFIMLKKFLSKIYLKYLQILTGTYVKRNKIDIFGLTGSAGKTTLTVELYSILSKKYRTGMTFQDGHGFNSETGIPFALLGVHVDGYSPLDWLRYLFQFTWNFFFKKSEFEKYVIEMGVDKPGDMDFILSMTKADLGIFLSISKTHSSNFETKAKELGMKPEELLFEEKAKLIRSIAKEGFAVINFDDKLIYSLKDQTEAKVITFGLNSGADVRGKIIKAEIEEFIGEITYKNETRKIKINKFIVGEYTFRTLLAGIAVGLTYGISLKECIDAVEIMDVLPGRMTLIEGIKNTLIIDSSYNSAPNSLREALNNLGLSKNRTRVAVLGDMRELGELARQEHESIAEDIIKSVDLLVTIGPAMRDFLKPELIKKGFGEDKIFDFQNTWEALDFIRDELIIGREIILVKGSQNTLFLEIVVEGLMKNPKDREKLLARRGKFWDGKRAELQLTIGN